MYVVSFLKLLKVCLYEHSKISRTLNPIYRLNVVGAENKEDKEGSICTLKNIITQDLQSQALVGDDFMIALVVSDLSYRVYLDFDTIDTVCLGLEIRRVPKQGSLVITYSTYDGLEVSETLSR